MKKIGFLSFGHWSPPQARGTRSARRRAAAVDRPRGRRRGTRRRRRLFPRPPLRPPARLALPAARRHRRPHQAHRDRHRRHRHALREPALHGRGRGRGRPDRRRPAAARHQPRLARAGDRRLAPFRLRARPRARPTPTWRAATPRSSSSCSRARASPSRTRGRCSPTRPASCASSRIPRACASASGGAPPPTPPRSGRRELGMNLQSSTLKFDESGEPFHVQQAKQIRAYRDAWKEAGHARAAARLGQPQHLRADERPGPRLFRPLRRERRSDRLPSTRTPARSSAAPTPPSPTAGRGAGRRTRRSPRPTRCC